MGDVLSKLTFLIIENKVSKHGYHKSNIIKNGDKFAFELYIFIKKNENIDPSKYDPESPKKNIFEMLKRKQIIKIIIK